MSSPRRKEPVCPQESPGWAVSTKDQSGEEGRCYELNYVTCGSLDFQYLRMRLYLEIGPLRK